MRIGCCASTLSPAADGAAGTVVDAIARAGFDYVELALMAVADLPAAAFRELVRRVDAAGVRCEAFNCFFPARVRLTGPDARPQAALDYAAPALDRAAALGAELVVFGSAAARNVPAGAEPAAAWRQLVLLLQRLGPLAAERALTIVIEPLNRGESNIVNTAAEGLQLARAVNHPHVQLLVDYYHLALERESPDVLLHAGAAVRHLHTANVAGRALPVPPDDGMRPFFECARRAGYAGRCSVEGVTSDFAADAPRALAALREAVAR
jgi:sugar phosphate isomerase/epimerase